MKASELRAKAADDLQHELRELLKAQFSLRMQHATQQLGNTSQLRKVRRDIARVRTDEPAVVCGRVRGGGGVLRSGDRVVVAAACKQGRTGTGEGDGGEKADGAMQDGVCHGQGSVFVRSPVSSFVVPSVRS